MRERATGPIIVLSAAHMARRTKPRIGPDPMNTTKLAPAQFRLSWYLGAIARQRAAAVRALPVAFVPGDVVVNFGTVARVESIRPDGSLRVRDVRHPARGTWDATPALCRAATVDEARSGMPAESR